VGISRHAAVRLPEAGQILRSIAATAYEMRATLATGNGKHYPMKDIKKEVVKFFKDLPEIIKKG
jgi:hypothetical protein